MNCYLFIVPLTPFHLLTAERKKLQTLCLETLKRQTYGQWLALLIGDSKPEIEDKRFICLSFEGQKEEKIQKATQYLKQMASKPTHIIRLDDDDIFNPFLLEKLKNLRFDLYTDMFQAFWNPATGLVAQKIFYWLPNTCIHSLENATAVYGTFPPGDYLRFHAEPLLIENEHNDFHFYYRDKYIMFASKSQPVYLRSLNPDSITSSHSSNFQLYLNQHGIWRTNKFRDFHFLKFNSETRVKTRKQSLIHRLKHLLYTLRVLRNYKKVIIGNGR